MVGMQLDALDAVALKTAAPNAAALRVAVSVVTPASLTTIPYGMRHESPRLTSPVSAPQSVRSVSLGHILGSGRILGRAA